MVHSTKKKLLKVNTRSISIDNIIHIYLFTIFLGDIKNNILNQ